MRIRRTLTGYGVWGACVILTVAVPIGSRPVAADEPAARQDTQVSFHRDIAPIFKANCNDCHRPGRARGELDLTTHTALVKGGRHGSSIVPGQPEDSELYNVLLGDPPEMPEDGDPLKPEEVELIRLWIAQGAADDTPAEPTGPVEPPVYEASPVISAMTHSPDGSLLAVAGYHEVLLHKADGSERVARLVGRAPRVEGIAFSPDGSLLAVCGGAPSEFGHVQIWNVADPGAAGLLHEYRIGYDSLYGISFAPDGKTVSFGGADRVVRQLEFETGQVLMEFKAHADWVFGTTYTRDGSQLVTAGRDRAMKLVNLETQRFVDDINNPLDQIVSFSRHPKEDQVVYGGHLGGVRIYRISDNQGRTAGRVDTNLIRAFEQQGQPVHAVAFSPDGTLLAVGISGEVRIYVVEDGKRKYVLSDHEGPVYAISWSPQGDVIATAGFDGWTRLYRAADGELIHKFIPVPLGAVAERQAPAAVAEGD